MCVDTTRYLVDDILRKAYAAKPLGRWTSTMHTRYCIGYKDSSSLTSWTGGEEFQEVSRASRTVVDGGVRSRADPGQVTVR